MLKNNKGVTLIALVITIMIMIVLAGATVATSNIVEEAQKQQIATNMLLIQTKVKIIMERVEFYNNPETYNYIGTKVGEKLYEFDSQEILDSIGLEGIKLNGEKYIIDYSNGDVTYKKGETEYKLSEMK